LQEASRYKKIRLVQAYDALLFLRSLDELNGWMDEIETHLSTEDYGKLKKMIREIVSTNY
jgi:spectrin beta